MKLENFNIYNLSMNLAEVIYNEILNWEYFDKSTLGKQLIRSADSISANLSEGLGRYHFKERKHFNYYARGSLFETKTWITKAHNRKLINDEVFHNLNNSLEILSVKLNKYIKTIG